MTSPNCPVCAGIVFILWLWVTDVITVCAMFLRETSDFSLFKAAFTINKNNKCGALSQLIRVIRGCDSVAYLIHLLVVSLEPAKKRKTSPVWEYFDQISFNKVGILYIRAHKHTLLPMHCIVCIVVLTISFIQRWSVCCALRYWGTIITLPLW